jgi:hypothetical protein
MASPFPPAEAEIARLPGDVVVVNTTERSLALVVNGEPQGAIAPGEERIVGQYIEATTFGRLIARIPDGERVFTPWVTWEYLIEHNFRIEIVDDVEG